MQTFVRIIDLIKFQGMGVGRAVIYIPINHALYLTLDIFDLETSNYPALHIFVTGHFTSPHWLPSLSALLGEKEETFL